MKQPKQKESEKDIQKTIIQYLELKRIFFYRQNSGAFQNNSGGFYRFASMSGLSDLVLIINGQYIAVEIKGEKGKLSDNQFEFGKKLIDAGGQYWIIRSLDNLIEELKTLNL